MTDGPNPTAGHLLTIDEAAAFLNVPARWVSEAVRQRRVRCTRIGKHVRFRLEHLEELVTAREQPVASPALNDVSQLSRADGGPDCESVDDRQLAVTEVGDDA